MATQYKYLFTPLKIGPVTVPNRVVLTGHGDGLADQNPKAAQPALYGERYARYLAERAKGGVGLIIYGLTQVHPTTAFGSGGTTGVSYKEGALPGFKLATEMIHEHGAKVFIQLSHAGAHGGGTISRLPVWSASAVTGEGAMMDRETPKQMEIEDIREIIEYFGRCAEYGRAGGFDGVEILTGTSFLLHQFLSPFWNHRTDEYGGSLENRMRFILQVIDRVSKAIGDGMALGIRLTLSDVHPIGLSVDDMKDIARRLEATGKVHYFNVMPASHATRLRMPTMYEPHCTLVPQTAELKKAVNIPVVAVSRIVAPQEGEKILAEGQADLIGMCRALISDPELVNKAREGREKEIRLCTGCCQSCLGNRVRNLPIGCTQNPVVGEEKEWGIGTLKPAARKKRVIVVGGGPAGMEAAWVAAARGHQVTLYEKNQELGGQINLAAKLPGRAETAWWATWRKTMVARYGVKVVLGREVTAEDVLKENPDAVVVATGSTPLRDGFQAVTGEPIPGWDRPNVVVVDDILEGKAKVGERVLILDEEAHVKAPAIADMLSREGKEVEIVDRHLVMGSDLDAKTYGQVNIIMAQRGFKFTPLTFVRSIDADGVTVYNVVTRASRKVNVDTVILNTGRRASEELYYALKGKVKELHRIGDCVAPRLVHAAIYDGHKVGREL